MTPQEQQMIDGLISRIRTTQVQNKDSEAEQHIQQGLAGYPDALYVLTQTVLVQQYGLDQAQAQINELKQQVQTLQDQASQHAKSSGGGSFLSHIFGGGNDSNTQAQAPQQSVQPQSYQPVNNPGYGGGYTQAPPPPPAAYPPQGYPSPAGGGLFGRGGGGGFMQGALQTAAGVAAGEMVFRGMEDLFSGFGGHHGGYGFGAGGGGGETIINNYGDDDRGSDRNFADHDRDNDQGFYNTSDDASRNLDSSSGLGSTSNFADTTDDNSSFDNSNDFDDSSSFDSSSDDFSSDDNS